MQSEMWEKYIINNKLLFPKDLKKRIRRHLLREHSNV